MRKLIALAVWAGFVCAGMSAYAQTAEELINAGKNTENVPVQGMGYDLKNHSPLKQINKSNVKRLVPIWSISLMNDFGETAQPTIYNGVMYAINAKWTFAIDVATGRQIWRTAARMGAGSRGAGVLRRDQPRHRDHLQRQAVSHHARQSRARARHENRQADVEAEVRRLQGRLHRHQRAAHRQRRADHRHGGRRVHHARLSERLGSGNRQAPVAPLHRARARRERLGDLAEGHRRLEVRRRADVAQRRVRSRARSRLLGHRQPGAVGAAQPRRARQPVCEHPARDTARRPASSCGTTSTRRTTCTTWTAPTSRCSPTSRSKARSARCCSRSTRTASCTRSTAPTAS